MDVQSRISMRVKRATANPKYALLFSSILDDTVPGEVALNEHVGFHLNRAVRLIPERYKGAERRPIVCSIAFVFVQACVQGCDC